MNGYVFISGATSGIGMACAKRFAAKKWNLILTGRRQDRLTALKTELEGQFEISVLPLCFDVRNESDVNRYIDQIPANVQKEIRIVINNAGLAVGRGPIQSGLTEDWERMIDTNIKGLLFVTRAMAPILIGNGSGHFINISSIAGKEVYPGGNVYCATKHAVDALSKAMRIDLVEQGIKVTNIAPGAVETEFSLVRFKGDEKTAGSVYDGFTPLTADDIANVILFAAEQPPHVNLNDITIMPTAQASSTVFHKTSAVTKEA
jgi:NADP-dependent 3-hydroxy acid dehydrogenase YdfG